MAWVWYMLPYALGVCQLSVPYFVQEPVREPRSIWIMQSNIARWDGNITANVLCVHVWPEYNAISRKKQTLKVECRRIGRKMNILITRREQFFPAHQVRKLCRKLKDAAGAALNLACLPPHRKQTWILHTHGSVLCHLASYEHCDYGQECSRRWEIFWWETRDCVSGQP